MSEIMDQLIENSKIKSLALMLQDGISEEKVCWYLQISLEQREGRLRDAQIIQRKSNDNHMVE